MSDRCLSSCSRRHCDTPVGPCTISPVPVNRMQNNTPITMVPGGPSYLTTYGGTLIKRSRDWLVLSAISQRGNIGGIWGLAAMVSKGKSPDPAESPYTQPQLMLYPESDVWHPARACEFYP